MADGDPNNYLTYYKRGIVYLALEKPKLALADFDKVLELKPDFIAARSQRGTVLLKQGLFDAAEEEFNSVVCSHFLYITSFKNGVVLLLIILNYSYV